MPVLDAYILICKCKLLAGVRQFTSLNGLDLQT